MKISLLGLTVGVVLTAANAAAQNTFPASGNVGIGTTAPSAPLQVVGTGMGALVLGEANPASGKQLMFGVNTTGNGYGTIQALYQGNAYTPLILNLNGGAVGIGTSSPQGQLHVVGNNGFASNASSPTQFGSANAFIQASYGARIPGTGAALSFAFPANTDGSNIWDQARILATPDNGNSSDASGRMYLQTRYSVPNSWSWNNNLILTSDGAATFGGNIKLTSGSGSSITFQDGSVQTVAWNGILAGADYAESVDVTGDRSKYEPGDVLVIDSGAERTFLKSATPYSTKVMGIYSTKPGVLGRPATAGEAQLKGQVPMAMVGIVPTKVSAENGPIEPGDLLVTSSKMGYAMKGTDRSRLAGAIVGKALGSLDTGVGLIEVAVSLQ